MRVIAGSRRGMKLYEFEGRDIRPTTDRVKENIFNIINMRIESARFLDLFGGTGAMGIEAASRGAEKSVITDNSEDSVKLIKKNIEKADFSDKCTLVCADALSYISRTDEKFDIIFLDPPYHDNLMEKTLKLIAEKEILDDDGIIVCERDFSPDGLKVDGLELVREKKYGRVQILLYTVKRG